MREVWRGYGSNASRKKEIAAKKAPLQAEQILQVQDLSIYYGEKRAVNHISFEIEKNAITALIEPIRLREINLFTQH